MYILFILFQKCNFLLFISPRLDPPTYLSFLLSFYRSFDFRLEYSPGGYRSPFWRVIVPVLFDIRHGNPQIFPNQYVMFEEELTLSRPTELIFRL